MLYWQLIAQVHFVPDGPGLKSGNKVFRFVAVSPGEATLSFQHR
jgi:hypothetical protein